MNEKSVVDFLLKHEQQDQDKVYLRQPRDGQWHEFTWGDVLTLARRIANFLKKLGLKEGDHVAIYSKNCAEWFITDFGITMAGMVNVPLFPNQHKESIEYVLKHAEVKLVLIGKLDNYQIARSNIPSDLILVNFDYHKDIAANHQWEDVIACEPLKELATPKPEDIYTIIYSSGTSGKPKGAVYTHQAILNYLSLFPDDIARLARLNHYRLLSYLPLAHVYERSAIQLGSLAIPCTVSFVQSLDTFAENLRDVKPSVFAAVPRVWGVFQSKIEQKTSSGLAALLLKLPFLSELVKYKVKKKLGLHECYACVSGAAHLPESIYYFFDKLGIPIQEGYGQTENMAYATVSLLNERKAGFVGTARLGVKLKKGDKNELIMTSPCLMSGYYKDREATKNVFTSDGWLHTGDIVEIDSKNRVKVLGRLSEVFKNQKGEFIQPTPIEKKFSENPFVENLCLVGQGLQSNVMVVSLTKSARQLSRQEIADSLIKTLHQVNADLKSYEKISHVLPIEDTWSTDNNFLTPTLKVMRRIVASRYQGNIQKAFQEPNGIVWS